MSLHSCPGTLSNCKKVYTLEGGSLWLSCSPIAQLHPMVLAKTPWTEDLALHPVGAGKQQVGCKTMSPSVQQ